jgi:hypothetical protein
MEVFQGNTWHSGDGGFVAKFSDGTVTDSTWKAQSFFSIKPGAASSPEWFENVAKTRTPRYAREPSQLPQALPTNASGVAHEARQPSQPRCSGRVVAPQVREDENDAENAGFRSG